MISGSLTSENGANAVRFQGDTWTLCDLFARRSIAPRRFDFHHPRLGSALKLGIDGLVERRSIAPERFDFYHPMLAHLLDDVTTDHGPGCDVIIDDGQGATGGPVIVDPPVVAPHPPAIGFPSETPELPFPPSDPPIVVTRPPDWPDRLIPTIDPSDRPHEPKGQPDPPQNVVIPEPASFVMVGTAGFAACGLGLWRRRWSAPRSLASS